MSCKTYLLYGSLAFITVFAFLSGVTIFILASEQDSRKVNYMLGGGILMLTPVLVFSISAVVVAIKRWRKHQQQLI